MSDPQSPQVDISTLKALELFVEGEEGMERAYVSIGWHSQKQDGRILLTPDCVTVREVAYYAKKLKEELDEIVAQSRLVLPKG
jgi:hypothetical protein